MSSLSDLDDVVSRLRGPQGCPWDRAQDLRSMRPYLLEEVHELLEALDSVDKLGDAAAPALCEELGDSLFVLALLARIAEEQGWFTLDDAADAIRHKMVVRHPHVFGEGVEAGGKSAATLSDSSAGSIAAWEARKAAPGPDGRPRSRLAGVPRELPGLLRAHRQGEKAAAVGFDWGDHRGALAKVQEELAELMAALSAHPPVAGQPAAERVEDELGDLLMATASLGRHLGAPPEAALRRANDRFRTRFERVERIAIDRGHTLSDLDEATLDAMWEQAKAELGHNDGDH